MALDTLRRDKIEGGLALSYQQLTELFPEAKAVPQVGKAKQVFATLFERLAATKTAAR